MCQYVRMPCTYKCGHDAGLKITYQQVGNCGLCGIPQLTDCGEYPIVDINIELNETCLECLAGGEWFVNDKIWSKEPLASFWDEELLAWFWDEELLARFWDEELLARFQPSG